jgi:D-3-phosphoglycerate dehydrogenase
MNVVGSDAVPVDADLLAKSSVRQVPIDELLADADVVLLASALTPDNRHMMNSAAFARMKAGSYLVNVGRGPLVDEAALAAALSDGKLAGAGLDVFEVEPLPAESPLRAFENCVFGTHNGSNTRDAVDRVNRMTVEIALDVLGRERASFTPNRVA